MAAVDRDAAAQILRGLEVVAASRAGGRISSANSRPTLPSVKSPENRERRDALLRQARDEFCGPAPCGSGLLARPRPVGLRPILGEGGGRAACSELELHIDANEPVPVGRGWLLRQGGLP